MTKVVAGRTAGNYRPAACGPQRIIAHSSNAAVSPRNHFVVDVDRSTALR